ncbi:DUF4244 domain-containing protein [Corynebacterium sp. CNCTC7651]|uniref:DUF4244 domain-containing protein n=1 Tax=Corynebacterium TaxID=1716 RepID=UPI00351D1AC3
MNLNLSTTAIRAQLAAEEVIGKSLRRVKLKLNEDVGMSTIEYAFGSLAAAALAGVLYMVVNGNGVTSAIEGVITKALSNTPG